MIHCCCCCWRGKLFWWTNVHWVAPLTPCALNLWTYRLNTCLCAGIPGAHFRCYTYFFIWLFDYNFIMSQEISVPPCYLFMNQGHWPIRRYCSSSFMICITWWAYLNSQLAEEKRCREWLLLHIQNFAISLCRLSISLQSEIKNF